MPLTHNQGLALDIHPIATVNRTEARSIKSSIHESGDIWTRLDSIYGVFPKMVMGERNRHRCFSLSDRSSRAVPPEKLIEEIRRGIGLAMPAKFRRRAKGMGGGEELTGDELIAAQLDWILDALNACDGAERALARDEEKETVNRRLDMYIYMHTLQTATWAGWLNFEGLRLANASPTIELYAEKCFNVLKTTTAEVLKPGEWHLPFADLRGDDDYEIAGNLADRGVYPDPYATISEAINLSAARSAHLSYNDIATGQQMTVPRALDIAAKLRDSRPLHASPFEHQATPDVWTTFKTYRNGWLHPQEHGNLPGWRQARKMIPGEMIAPLPMGWEL